MAILAGGIVDQPAGPDDPPALRYAALRRSMSHETVLADARFRFAQTANCAIRRAAFDEAGGFCAERPLGRRRRPRLPPAAAGWELEARPDASVVHLNRTTLAGAAAPARAPRLRRRLAGRPPPGRAAGPQQARPGALVAGALGARGARRGDRDERLEAAIDPLAVWAFELGRLVPNQRR